jgi:hypothetical protein
MSLIAAAPIAEQGSAGYLERQTPIAVILGSFLVLTLPLCALAITNPAFLERFYVKPIFIWTLGTTHFVITLTIYLQSQNLRYFNSTWRNRLLYFVIPAGIFVLFDLYSALEVAVIAPAFDGLFRACIRLLDNHHVTRQSFGVSQLFKKRSGLPYPHGMRALEDVYFNLLTGMLLLTFFAGGQFDYRRPVMLVGAVVSVGLFLAIMANFVWLWRTSADRASAVAPMVYFLMQSSSTALGIYRTSLYLYCLTMHYLEYHVLMVPRCFNSPLDSTNATDRFYGRLRSKRVVFYGVVLAVAGAATYLTWISMGWLINKSWSDWPTPYRVSLALFDGLFVFHYFIEGLIWKFGNPFYRNTLGPLYFGSSAPRSAPTAR